jgi:hypothetical protein
MRTTRPKTSAAGPPTRRAGRSVSLALAGAVVLTLLALPSTAVAQACSSSASAPSASGPLITASGSASCASLAVTIEVCIELVAAPGVGLGCSSDAAPSGQTAQATATIPCAVSGRYRTSVRTSAVNAQGNLVFTSQSYSSAVNVTCPVP